MQLIRNKWTKNDMVEFQKYLESFAKWDKVEWTRKIINTNMQCLAIPSPTIKNIANEISKGDILSFVNNMTTTYDNLSITGFLIPKIKDFELMKEYLWRYANQVDNWGHCDLLKFKINKDNKTDYYNLAMEYVSSDKPFVKRIGLIILFQFLDDEYIDRVLSVCNTFETESEYYVNMCVAWLLCESFIKQRNKTLEFLKSHKLNDFTINKFVSKCRDSFRVSKEDKEMLLQFKKKKH